MSILMLLNQFWVNDLDTADRIDPIIFEKNIELSSYDVVNTAKLNDSEFLLTAKPKEYDPENEGLRLIYLVKDNNERFKIEFESSPTGEAYRYTPHYFKFYDGEIIILAEEAYEYTSGFDVFKLQNGKMEHLGFAAIAGDMRDSAIDQATIGKTDNEYKIWFTGTVEPNPISDNLISGEKIEVLINEQGLKLIEK